MGYWKKGDELNQGKLIVEEILGYGGFGVTYRVRQTRNNKLFCLKTLNEVARGKPDFQQLQSKFINEAIALANCRHPNIVKVHPQGFQEGDLWCMVMEYVEGRDLSWHLDEEDKFEESKAVEIVTKVGEALGFVHQQGLLHRDIKPANILLRKSDSTPVLIDFGLAREYNANPDSIRSMTNSMTECYAPIEQYQRQGKFGAWTDVYALAATLYVLVTKQPPFPARFREHAELIPPQKHNPQLSDRINEAVLKGMEIESGNRPQTVQKFLELLVRSGNIIAFKSSLVELKVFEFDAVENNNRWERIIPTKHYSARYFTEDIGNGLTLDIVKIIGGTFIMGSPKSEACRSNNESPQHKVGVSSFYMGKYQVTQAQWKQVAELPPVELELDPDPSHFKGENFPVESISWYEAVEFCKRLSKNTGKEYRLPSEAEWEYACRAGTTTPFHFGETITTDLANCYNLTDFVKRKKDIERTTSVGSFFPNAFGLYDMHGNIWEMCADDWHKNYIGAPNDSETWLSEHNNSKKIVRGGSCQDYYEHCRSATRGCQNPQVLYKFKGFRVVCIT